MTATMHRSGGNGWLTTWTPQLVVDAPDPVVAFANYVQQKIGVPWPTLQDMKILRGKIKEFFSHYPKATFHTLCRIVDWARARRRRFDRVWKVVEAFRLAWVDGALPELNPSDRDDSVEARIAAALEAETDQVWRQWLIGAEGTKARREVVEDWEDQRKAACGVH